MNITKFAYKMAHLWHNIYPEFRAIVSDAYHKVPNGISCSHTNQPKFEYQYKNRNGVLNKFTQF